MSHSPVVVLGHALPRGEFDDFQHDPASRTLFDPNLRYISVRYYGNRYNLTVQRCASSTVYNFSLNTVQFCSVPGSNLQKIQKISSVFSTPTDDACSCQPH
jgi:hypothetical protein